MKYIVLIIALLHFGQGNYLLDVIIDDLQNLTESQLNRFNCTVATVHLPKGSMKDCCDCGGISARQLGMLLMNVESNQSHVKVLVRNLKKNLRFFETKLDKSTSRGEDHCLKVLPLRQCEYKRRNMLKEAILSYTQYMQTWNGICFLPLTSQQ
ncbi:hypothetical protein AAFF_G00246540 [Aldrovandia affinis]|uniref:Uncharacterized protein n=1 Tax=Aldrovandia affinis TaxID=143900 RepID=A0AAD7WTF9_9TELE|nr:hypothetical protein AAFF_G00246540 [Aldrovandia affinis]